MEELRHSSNLAWSLLHRAMRSDKLTPCKGELFDPLNPLNQWERDNLVFDYQRYKDDAQFDPCRYQAGQKTGEPVGSLRIGRESVHPHGITISAEVFNYWLAKKLGRTRLKRKILATDEATYLAAEAPPPEPVTRLSEFATFQVGETHREMTQAPQKTGGTSGGVAETTKFLIAEMTANRDTPKTNADLWREVEKKFNVSGRGFKRAKGNAIIAADAPLWGKGGRKSAH